MSNLIEIKKTVEKLKTTCFAMGENSESCREGCEYFDHWDGNCMLSDVCNDVNAVFDYCEELQLTEWDIRKDDPE